MLWQTLPTEYGEKNNFITVKEKKMLYLGAIAAMVLLVLLPGSAFGQSMESIAADLIISFEGFVDHPYWDVSRYSWGYGTPAATDGGSITEAQAREELMEHVQYDYDYLKG